MDYYIHNIWGHCGIRCLTLYFDVSWYWVIGLSAIPHVPTPTFPFTLSGDANILLFTYERKTEKVIINDYIAMVCWLHLLQLHKKLPALIHGQQTTSFKLPAPPVTYHAAGCNIMQWRTRGGLASTALVSANILNFSTKWIHSLVLLFLPRAIFVLPDSPVFMIFHPVLAVIRRTISFSLAHLKSKFCICMVWEWIHLPVIFFDWNQDRQDSD